MNSQNMKQLRVGPFTVTKQITNTTNEIRGDSPSRQVEDYALKSPYRMFSERRTAPSASY